MPGVVFAFPVDSQVDVPVGTNVVVSFSETIDQSALGQCQIVGSAGPVTATATATPDGTGVLFAAPPLSPGSTYQVVLPAAIDPAAQNLPASGPLLSFTTRTTRPRAAPPALVAVNGGDPTNPESFRPMLDTSTIRLVFSEPLDMRTVTYGPGSIELVDGSGSNVPATLLTDGVHVSIDPIDDLTGGASYMLQIGGSVVDLGGQAIAPTMVALTARDTKGTTGGSTQTLRVRMPSDPPIPARAGATDNQVVITNPLIGTQTQTLGATAFAGELGDPSALDGPLAFTIRRGRTLALSGLTVELGGQIPVGVSTGDIFIQFLSDGGGRIYRNPNQSPDQIPDDGSRAPLYADLSFDVGIYSVDPTGNAVLAQTVMGVQAAGTVTIADGALSIETVTAMDFGLLGVADAPSNLVLSMITDASAAVPPDTTPPMLVATSPAEATDLLQVDSGVELIFSEPIDLDQARAGGITLEQGSATVVATELESHGSVIVVRPLAPLAYSTSYQVVLNGVADLAGNALETTAPITFATPPLASTSSPVMIEAVYPGVPCALTAQGSGANGHCAGGQSGDDAYAPFALPADEDIVVVFTQPPNPSTLQLGSACGDGTVRVEQVDDTGTCTGAVPGTLIVHDHDLHFVADVPWTPGTGYQLTLASNPNGTDCDGNEICGINGDAANFDPLNGAQSSGGPDLVIEFVAAMASDATYMTTIALPFSDINGDGQVDGNEEIVDANRAGMAITGTSGAISDAKFNNPRCPQDAGTGESCMYMSGAMPAEIGDYQASCSLPDGSTAPCMPVNLTPQIMYGTSVSMSATVGIAISTSTGTSVMRVRESEGGTVPGFITMGSNGMPQLEAALDLYLDAPDMSIPLSSDDLHSKQLSVLLEGPVAVQPDGRMAISAENVAVVPMTVNISAPLGISGGVEMALPPGEMKLQLVSPQLRGGPQ